MRCANRALLLVRRRHASINWRVVDADVVCGFTTFSGSHVNTIMYNYALLIQQLLYCGAALMAKLKMAVIKHSDIYRSVFKLFKMTYTG